MSDTVKAIRVERKNTERLPHIDEQPTLLEIPVVPKSPPRTTEKMIAQMFTSSPKDMLYFQLKDAQATTMDLIKAVVQICLKELKKYPFKIVLSTLRYLAMYKDIEWINSQSSIKLVCADSTADYDIMAVCEV